MVAEREDVEEKCLYATELFGTAARNCVETDVLGVRESVRSDDDAKDVQAVELVNDGEQYV